ncbi:MAG: AAA family ATPase [Firmicutes bacterium]|nr:AAA family ATPase [Bacillota bacterium]
MKFVLIFGPQAVGKMTVGQELAKITGFKLLHNHMTIEPLYALFGAGPETWRLSHEFRRLIFEAAAISSGMAGLIFTYVWALDLRQDWEFVEGACRTFEDAGGESFLVELEADLEERLRRNRTPYRLQQKPTKRDLARSEDDLRQTLAAHRLNSFDGEIASMRYLKIDNTHLSPDVVALSIKERFRL